MVRPVPLFPRGFFFASFCHCTDTAGNGRHLRMLNHGRFDDGTCFTAYIFYLRECA